MSIQVFCPPGEENAHSEEQGNVKCYGYLDIETTGLSRTCCDLTVVGVAVMRGARQRVRQLVGDQISAERVLHLLEGVNEFYTYNGSRFDLPFLQQRLNLDLRRQYAHTDLMYKCWLQNLKGGLKVVEARLGIERRLQDMNGLMAVRLWWDYVNDNDAQALQRLLEYNREDVVNLHALRQKLGVK
ncbi:MAG: ribonuclease H-like domain-containing protein [Sedimentisphaerales bacterium]|nr:ribonuclease H-like domain-containing protein [Sedimentisphaerales bacterium]